MRFVEKISNLGRVGAFTENPPLWNHLSIITPMCLTYARAGSVPHLTYDVFKRLNANSRGAGLMLHALPTVVNFADAVQQMGKGLGPYVGIDSPFHISMQDPATETPSGYNVKKGASVWTHGGKKMLKPKEFMAVIKSFLPFSYQALCDSDTPRNCPNKRLSKSVDHSLDFLDQCLEYHRESDELKDTLVFGTIQGGHDLEARKRSAKETVKREVDGFVIDGFHLNGPDVRTLPFEKIKPLLCEVIKILPSNKPRMLNGPLSPQNIIEAIKCGVDMFDTSYPFVLAESGEALNLQFLFDRDFNATLVKSLKYSIEIDLKDTVFSDKLSAIVEGCKCYCCANFTCAYVNHLLITSELLGPVLLMLHNLHQFYEFFNVIREAVSNQTLGKVEAMLASC